MSIPPRNESGHADSSANSNETPTSAVGGDFPSWAALEAQHGQHQQLLLEHQQQQQLLQQQAPQQPSAAPPPPATFPAPATFPPPAALPEFHYRASTPSSALPPPATFPPPAALPESHYRTSMAQPPSSPPFVSSAAVPPTSTPSRQNPQQQLSPQYAVPPAISTSGTTPASLFQVTVSPPPPTTSEAPADVSNAPVAPMPSPSSSSATGSAAAPPALAARTIDALFESEAEALFESEAAEQQHTSRYFVALAQPQDQFAGPQAPSSVAATAPPEPPPSSVSPTAAGATALTEADLSRRVPRRRSPEERVARQRLAEQRRSNAAMRNQAYYLQFFPVITIVLVIAAVYGIYLKFHGLRLLQVFADALELNQSMRIRGIYEMVIFHCFFLMFAICYFIVIFKSPGHIPDTPEWVPDVRPDVFVEPTSSSSPRTARQYDAKKSGQQRYCKWCEKYKPDRAHHCRKCGQCVLRMDHHCAWIYNCVGWGNHKHFVVTLFYGAVSAWFATVSLIPTLWDLVEREPIRFDHVTIVGLGMLLAIILALASSSLLVFQCWLMSHNLSTIDFCEKKCRFRGIKNSYDRGCWTNFKFACGVAPLCWLCPFDNRPGDGLHFPVNQEALSLLRARRFEESQQVTGNTPSRYANDAPLTS